MWREKNASTIRDFKVLATDMLLANNSAFSASVHWRQVLSRKGKNIGFGGTQCSLFSNTGSFTS